MIKLAIPALAALSLCAAAQAKTFDQTTVIVAYADLNLGSAAGAAALRARIDAAVKDVCTRPFIRDLKAMDAWDKCRADAAREAMRQVDDAAAPIEIAAFN